MTVKLLTEQLLEFLSLTGGCTSSSESIYVKMQHYWESCVAAHFIIKIGRNELVKESLVLIKYAISKVKKSLCISTILLEPCCSHKESVDKSGNSDQNLDL